MGGGVIEAVGGKERDSRRQDFAIQRIGVAVAELQRLAFIDFEFGFAQPRLHLAGGVGHLIARFVDVRQVGNVIPAAVDILSG
ncbi:hypothetical protein D3C77_277810 [compost metagenome]